MTARGADWLPDDALVAPALLAALDLRIEAWSARWFGERAVRRLERPGGAAAIALRPPPRHGWDRFGPDLWLDWGEQTPRTLALHALGRADVRAKVGAADAELLDLLGERIARDLAASLVAPPARGGSEAGGEISGGPERALTLTLCNKAQTLSLAVAVDAAALAALRKQQFRAVRTPAAQPKPLAIALGGVPVAYEVALGTARLGLLEFEAVEPGDTILLGQAVEAPLAVRATATATTIAEAMLVRQDGQLMLTAR